MVMIFWNPYLKNNDSSCWLLSCIISIFFYALNRNSWTDETIRSNSVSLCLRRSCLHNSFLLSGQSFARESPISSKVLLIFLFRFSGSDNTPRTNTLSFRSSGIWLVTRVSRSSRWSKSISKTTKLSVNCRISGTSCVVNFSTTFSHPLAGRSTLIARLLTFGARMNPFVIGCN